MHDVPLKARDQVRKLRKLSKLLGNRHYRRGLRHGVAGALEHAGVLLNRACETVLDVGANVGQFSLATRACMPAARIVAFEPLEEAARTFRRVFDRDPHVELHQAAIGPQSGTITMHVSARMDSSSILTIGESQTRVFPGTEQRTTEVVRVERLSSFVSTEQLVGSVLLKLDVQGFELPALHGCEELLPNIEYVYVECSFIELYENQALADEVIGYLRAKGFVLHGVHNVTYDRSGRSVQADLLFQRNR
jgi:FkbM family methyltransferase